MQTNVWTHYPKRQSLALPILPREGRLPLRNARDLCAVPRSLLLPGGSQRPSGPAEAHDAPSSQAVQSLLTKVMGDMSLMSASLRPRLLWVLVHQLNLHPMERETWKLLLSNLDALASSASQDKEHANRLALAAAQAGPFPHPNRLPRGSMRWGAFCKETAHGA